MVLFFYQRENLDFLVKNIPDIALHRLQLSRLIVSNALVLGRRGISPNVDKFLKDHGD